jgi:hypothetical protein
MREAYMDSCDARKRLNWLCEETAKRIEEEPDDKRFGDIFRLVDEIETLSKSLGLPEPPIQIVRYKRGVTGRAGAPEPFRSWQQLDQSVEPKFLQVFGYRLNDPEGSDAPREFAITATVEGGEEGQHWRDTSKAQARRSAVKTLRRWGRTLEASEAGDLDREATSKQRSSTAQPKRGKGQWLGEALILLRDHPEWTDARIARECGVDRSRLSRSKEFKKAAGLARGRKADLPRGEKTADGRLEAFDE